jgi:NhaP-type Na+/H+ or K+/H+ antiporter
VYLAYRAVSPYQYLFLLPGILFLINAIGITKSHKPVEINPYLKQLVISILLFSLAYGISLAAF